MRLFSLILTLSEARKTFLCLLAKHGMISRWRGNTIFITCIRDGMFFGAASYEDFRITFGDRPSQVVTADQQGCIAWTENIIYNSFSEMRFWELTVRIEGIGRFKGYRDIPVLFNPWSGNLLDPRYDDIDEIPDYAIVPMSSVFSVAEAQVMGFMPDTENLRMDKVNIFVHEIYNFDDRAEVDAEVQLTPQFFVRDENGVPEYKNFTSGKFLLRAALVEYIVGEEHVIPIATYDEVADLRVEDKGTIRFRSRFELSRVGDPNSHYEFVFRLIPLDAPAPLGQAVRMARVGRVLTRGMNSGDIYPIPDGMTPEQYVSKDSQHFGLYNNEDNKNFGIGIGSVKIRRGAFYDSYSTDPQRTQEIIYLSCLYDPITLQSLYGNRLEAAVINALDVENIEEHFNPITLTPNGCFESTGVMKYYMFDIERYMPFYLVIRGQSGPYKGITTTRKIFLNPWEESWVTFGVDSLRETPPVNNPNPTKRPEVYLENVKYNFLRNENDGFEVDKFMRMKMTKTFEIEVHPQIKSYHNFSGQVRYQEINYGIGQVDAYFVVPKEGKVDFQNIDLKDYRLVAHDSVQSKIENGILRHPIQFKINFSDMPRAVLRGLLVVEVSYPDSRVESGIFVSHFDLTSSGTSFNTLRLGLNSYSNEVLDEFFKNINIKADLGQLKSEKLAEENIDPTLSTTQLFRERVLSLEKAKKEVGVNPELITTTVSQIESSNSLGLSQGWFDRALRSNSFGEQTLKNFCDLVFVPERQNAQNTHYQHCLREPSTYVEAQVTRHVEEILSPVFKEEAQNVGMSLSQSQGISVGFGMSRGVSRSAGLSLSAGLKVPRGLGFLSTLGPGVGVSYGISHSFSESSSIGDNQSAGASFSRSVYTDYVNLSFEAKVQSCVLVRGKRVVAQGFQYINNTNARSTNVSFKPQRMYHICANQAQKEKLSELWYFIGMSGYDGQGMRDGMDLRENPFIQVIRGRSLFTQYYDRLTASNMVHFLYQVDTELMLNKYLDLVYAGETELPYNVFADNAFPGLVDNQTRVE
jgi:hypothetical protein